MKRKFLRFEIYSSLRVIVKDIEMPFSPSSRELREADEKSEGIISQIFQSGGVWSSPRHPRVWVPYHSITRIETGEVIKEVD